MIDLFLLLTLSYKFLSARHSVGEKSMTGLTPVCISWFGRLGLVRFLGTYLYIETARRIARKSYDLYIASYLKWAQCYENPHLRRGEQQATYGNAVIEEEVVIEGPDPQGLDLQT